MNEPTKEDIMRTKLIAAGLAATAALTLGAGAAFAASGPQTHRTVAAHPARVSLSRESSRDAASARERTSLDRTSSRDRELRANVTHVRSDSRQLERADR
jgi:hypothetical protein